MSIMPRPVVLVLVLLLANFYLAHSLSLGELSEQGEGRTRELEEAAKRDGRRITRGRYRMGYMFGKRSGVADSMASALTNSLAGKAISVSDLEAALQTDPALAEQVARHLDKNGDGYVAASELL